MHPVESRIMDTDDHIDLASAKRWLTMSVALLCLSLTIAIVGLVLSVDTLIQWVDSPSLDAAALAAGARPVPPLSGTASLAGFVMMVGGALLTLRTGYRISTVLDPLKSGKTFSWYADEEKPVEGKPKAKPASPMDEVVDHADRVINGTREDGWVTSEQAAAG